MARKLLLPLVAAIAIVALLATGCPDPLPVEEDWQPVVLRMAIRDNLAPWPESGDRIADKLEGLHDAETRSGFAVERIYGDSPGLWVYWGGTHPREGRAHMYTGGWISPEIPRDQGTIFDQMYTGRVMTWGPWVIYEDLLEEFPELDEASRRLRYREFSSMAEREALFETVLWEGMKFSPRIWVCDVAGISPMRPDVRVAANVAGGIGDPGWVHTVHFHDDLTPIAPDGDTVVRVELPDLFIEPWNPVEGSSWSYDMWVTRRALGDSAVMADPTEGPTGGLYWPQRLSSATVWADQDLPIGQTIPSAEWGDGLTLNQVPATDEVLVPPDDAWADWDAENQQWITVAEREAAEPDWDRTAATLTRVVYEDELWDRPLHDGSTISPADFLMAMIMTFDRGKEASPVFDKSEQAPVESLLGVFKGVEIVSLDPLTIDTWHDTWYMDLELFTTRHWFPQYGTYGWTGFWHKVALGWATEAVGYGSTGDMRMAWSDDKASEADPVVEQMDYTKGPPLTILESELAWCTAEDFMPYYDTIAAVYDAAGLNLDAEIAARWSNLNTFYNTRNHFWVGNGPYMIANALIDLNPIEEFQILTKFEDYPDDGYKWFRFLDPAPTPGVENQGAWVDRVEITREAAHADAVEKLKLGTIDIFAHPVTDPILVEEIEADLFGVYNFGSYREITFNPYRDPETLEPFFPEEFGGAINPFAMPRIREAMNYLLNRPLYVGEDLGGLGAPKWTALGTVFPDHARYYDAIVGPLEEEYSHDLARAAEIIQEEMEALGCELRPSAAFGGRVIWMFDYATLAD